MGQLWWRHGPRPLRLRPLFNDTTESIDARVSMTLIDVTCIPRAARLTFYLYNGMRNHTHCFNSLYCFNLQLRSSLLIQYQWWLKRYRYSFVKLKRTFSLLILSRHAGESLIIGDDVTVTILSIKGKQIRLGIDAPKDISVHREEIYHRIKSEAGVAEKQNPVDLPPEAE